MKCCKQLGGGVAEGPGFCKGRVVGFDPGKTRVRREAFILKGKGGSGLFQHQRVVP